METGVTQEQMLVTRAREEIEKRTGKTPEQLYEEREKRITDVIQLKVPDRIPVHIRGNYFAVKYAGIPASAVFYDRAAYSEAIVKTLLDFDPDIWNPRPDSTFSGFGLEKLGTVQYQWPGGTLPPEQHPQFLDMDIMKENEYDLFITDPGDFILRYYLPRVWKALAPLSKLPPLQSLMGSYHMVKQAPFFSSPEVIQAFQTIFEVGQEQAKFGLRQQEIAAAMGVPPLTYPGGNVVTPFDFLADYLRGMKGIAVDMFKRPQKLHTAMERILEWHLVRNIPARPEERGRRVQGGGAHWGSEAFLSRKQFETYYWPTWKKSLLSAIDMGFVPFLHPEGKSDDRIEFFLELPAGKAVLYGEVLDVVRAKEILGGHLCIMGGVPASLLWGGSPQEVEEHCKNLIKVCGKGGGFILSCAGVEDDAKPANVRAMVESVKKYGQY